jgi:phosphoribosylformimino-5-aminoimidazole carboxamide ribotide isomerase
MIVIPAIDLLDGKCVRLVQGDYARVTCYADNPFHIAHEWEQGGARRIHLVDLDGARKGSAVNQQILLGIAEAVTVPVEIGGGIRTLEQVQTYLDHGVDRVILGTAAYRNPDLLIESARMYPGRVWVGLDARAGKVAVQGWLEDTGVSVLELARVCQDRGAGGIIFTDISKDGMLEGTNLDSLMELVENITIPVIASGGVSSLADLSALRKLQSPQIVGCIIGKALYAKAFTLKEAIQVLEGDPGQ